MTPRSVWFVAGSAAGIWASVKVRRAAERLSMPGLVDQAAALGEGWREFSAEVRDGMRAREREIVRDLHRRAGEHAAIAATDPPRTAPPPAALSFLDHSPALSDKDPT